MAAHDFPFLGIELARLFQNRAAHSQFSDIMQDRGAAQHPARFGWHSQYFGDPVGDHPHPRAVACGVGAFGIDNIAKGKTDIVEIVLVDRDILHARLECP